MHLVFAEQPFPTKVLKSIFLEGPSVRAADQRDWRHEALRTLETFGYDGHVFIPIPESRFFGAPADQPGWTYDGQIAWECRGRALADIIVAWVPREIDRSRDDLGMPGFTTNVEIGEDLHSGKLVYGRPDSAPKNRYLDVRVRDKGLPVFHTLDETLEHAAGQLGEGALRQGGETEVPLFIWRSEQFQNWYADLTRAGNRLDGASLHYHLGASAKGVFAYVLGVKVWVDSEGRHKSNEVVFARKDVSSIFAWHQHWVTGEVKLALVREFRSTVSNERGFVYELPGGSSIRIDGDPLSDAREELAEEAGLHVADPQRFRVISQRQLMGTFSTHKAVLFAVELTDEELAHLEAAQTHGTVFGESGTSERTHVIVATVKEAFTHYPLDYSSLGMIAQAMHSLGLSAISHG